MSLKRNTENGLIDVGAVKRWDGTAWVDCAAVRRWDGTAWVQVFPVGQSVSKVYFPHNGATGELTRIYNLYWWDEENDPGAKSLELITADWSWKRETVASVSRTYPVITFTTTVLWAESKTLWISVQEHDDDAGYFNSSWKIKWADRDIYIIN